MKTKKKIALVTGGSRGIGKAIVLRLAKSGFNIWLAYKSNHDAAEKVKTEVKKIGAECELICFDISDYKATQAALAAKVDAEPPHVVVYNAGIARDNLFVG